MNCLDRVFPSWNRRGGCASKKKARSLRSGADGVVIMVKVDLETLSGTDHPEGVNELQVRPHSPPYEGGVAVPSRKRTRSEMARTGWSLTSYVAECVLKHGA